MSADHNTRLSNLTEKLTEVVLVEADPDNWPGAGKRPADLTKDERGDRYWDKKNAAASLTLLIKVHSLIGMSERNSKPGGTGDGSDADFELGQQVNKAEREAMSILERVMQKGKKAG